MRLINVNLSNGNHQFNCPHRNFTEKCYDEKARRRAEKKELLPDTPTMT